MDQLNIEQIKKTVQDFFKAMDLGAEVKFQNIQGSNILVDLKMEDPQLLIGEGGQTLQDTQRLLRIILRKKAKPELPLYVDLDINGYKKKKIDSLKEMAKTVADEVAITKKEKSLPIMSAYERRVVHAELASRNDVATGSIGQEPERRIVVRPYF